MLADTDGLICRVQHGLKAVPLRAGEICALAGMWQHADQLQRRILLFEMQHNLRAPDINAPCRAGVERIGAVPDCRADLAVKQALQHVQRNAGGELLRSVAGKAYRERRLHQLVKTEPPINSRTSDCSGIHSLPSGVSCSRTLRSIGIPVSGAEASASFRTVSSRIG